MDLYQQNPEFKLAERICKVLIQNGHEALLAGGCVRDFLLKRSVNDFDVATSATPDQVEALFPKTLAVGKSFGVIIVIEQNLQVEVATFRKDGDYKDGRRPEAVEFSEAKEDAQRRDFTVNGLFYDLASQKVVDYVDGQKDLTKRQIRAIGQPRKRFEEDHLRILRAIRFSAQLDFEIESETFKAIQDLSPLIQTVSGERLQEEITKLLMSAAPEKGLELFHSSRVLEKLLTGVALKWADPKFIFKSKSDSKEDRWFRFFFWLKTMIQPQVSLDFFEELCERFKFSRELKQKSLKALAWTYQDQLFMDQPLGEILAASFEPEHQRGIKAYIDFYLKPEEKDVYAEYLKLKKALGDQKPTPWVTAQDLSKHLQGEALGKALKQSYWLQLEGKAQSKEELLVRWKK